MDDHTNEYTGEDAEEEQFLIPRVPDVEPLQLTGSANSDSRTALCLPLAFIESTSQVLLACWNRGLLSCTLSALFFSANAVIVKYLSNVPVFQIAASRSSLSLVTTYLLMRANGIRRIWSSSRNVPWLTLRGAAGSSAMLLFYIGLQTTPLADAQSIFFLYPAATATFSFLFLRERLRALQVAGVLASLAGVVLIAHPPMLFGGRGSWGPERAAAISFLVGSALMAATAITVIRKLSADESSIVMALWFHMTALAVSIPALAAGWPRPIALRLSGFEWFCLFGVAVTSFLAQLLFNRGIQLMTGATAACIASLQVPLAHLWGVVIFHEPPSLFGVLGTVLVIAGLVAVNFGGLAKGSSTGTEEGGVAPAAAVICMIRTRSYELLNWAKGLGRKVEGTASPSESESSGSGGTQLPSGQQECGHVESRGTHEELELADVAIVPPDISASPTAQVDEPGS
uniref:Membrane protein n=1 Tax=Tetraselmis sp. GSL018 TaxID=582737 RepID=A0A061RDF1_9CHLO